MCIYRIVSQANIIVSRIYSLLIINYTMKRTEFTEIYSAGEGSLNKPCGGKSSADRHKVIGNDQISLSAKRLYIYLDLLITGNFIEFKNKLFQQYKNRQSRLNSNTTENAKLERVLGYVVFVLIIIKNHHHRCIFGLEEASTQGCVKYTSTHRTGCDFNIRALKKVNLSFTCN